MKSTKFISILGMFALVLLTLNLVSAVASENGFVISIDGAGTSSSNPVSGALGDDISFNVKFETTNSSYLSGLDLNWSGTDISSGIKTNVGNTSFPPTITIGSGQSHGFKVTVKDNLTGDLLADLSLSVYYKDNATVDNSSNDSFTYCGYSTLGDLNVEIIDMSVEEGFGDDEEYWYPLDKIEVEVEVSNDGDWDIQDIELEVCLRDNEAGKCVMDEDDMDISDSKFDIDEGDDEQKVTITFDVNPKDFKEGNNDYTLYVKATGKIDDSSSAYNNQKTCVSDDADIEIKTDEKFVIIDEISAVDLTTSNEEGKVSCGSEIQLTGRVWNIGDEKIDEDEIYLLVYNKDLGINEVIDMPDISSLDNEEFSIRLNLPENLDKKYYTLTLEAYEDEDLSDNEIYENSEDDEASFRYVLEIVNCAAIPNFDVTISADLLSEAKVGENLIVDVPITNNGAQDATFVISTEAYESWAESPSIEPAVLSVDAGTSEKVTITFNPTKSGTQTFRVVATEVGGEKFERTVSVSVAEKAGFLTGAFSGVGSTTTYLIAGIILLLVIIVVVLIVKLAGSSRRESASEF